MKMKKILVIGAGRSAVTLIKYLLDNAKVNNWFVTVADFSVDLAKETVGNLESIVLSVVEKIEKFGFPSGR